jgi:hypothetical protein
LRRMTGLGEMLLEEKLMDIIVNMDHEQLTLAFQGCTDREITEKEELDDWKEEE